MSKLLDYLQKNGRTPQVEIIISPLDKSRSKIHLDRFLNYSFSSSIIIPVDAFSFTFVLPSEVESVSDYIREGDVIELIAGDALLCTGIIDVVDTETTIENGDIINIHGRNLLGQLEDQATVTTNDRPIYAKNTSLASVVSLVKENTRIRGLKTQGVPSGNYLFATEPGESKLSAIQRFVEPLNCLIWGDPKGNIVIGKPNMGSDSVGDIFCDRKERSSNVLSIKAIRSSTQIPNIYIPVWNGTEGVLPELSASQRLLNPADGPKRLRNLGHQVQKCVIVSAPNGSSPQSLSEINAIKVGGSNILQAYALREMHRTNMGELIVQANVKSHYNENLEPFLIDQIYNINYPRASVQEKMYLYQVEYTMDVNRGTRTSLYFCKLNTIVSGVSIDALTQKLTSSGKLPKV